MHLVRTRRGDVSHLHRAVGDGAQDGIERRRHGMTPRTDCVIRVENGRGSATPSTTSTPPERTNAATDQPRRSPTGTPAGASPYSIRFRWLTNDVNTVSRSTSTTPATQKRPVTT